jgi:hypothetical protein
MYVDDDDEGYVVDAPVSQGDGFSFTGGKYSDEMGRAEEWYARGKIVNAYPVEGRLEKAKDPLFGLAMGEASQISSDSFRWFYVEEGDRSKPSILLVHGIPSQVMRTYTLFGVIIVASSILREGKTTASSEHLSRCGIN